MDTILAQIWKLLTDAKVELSPLYAVISVAIIGAMKLVKDPNRLKWFTVLGQRTRAWTVAIFAFGLTFGVSILVLKERAWLEMTAASVVVGLCAVGAYEWLKAISSSTTEKGEPAKDPRRP